MHAERIPKYSKFQTIDIVGKPGKLAVLDADVIAMYSINTR
jgi:hypothetical protein